MEPVERTRCPSWPDGRRRLRRARSASTRSAGSRRSPSARTRRAGGSQPEDECRLRTPFQRDRDRIVHSKPFRRLKGKTQVFIDPAGDHYRTRMTHTLETTGDLARRRAGAAAERGPRRGDRARPRHRPHAVRPRGRGRARRGAARALRPRLPPQRAVAARSPSALNLTAEVRDGILTHTGEREPATLEGKIVRIVDRVAYINHDIDDAIRHGLLERGDLPRDEIELLGPTRLDADRRARPRPRRELRARAGDIVQSEEVGAAMLSLRAFMFERVYLGRARARRARRARATTVAAIFDHLVERGDPADEHRRLRRRHDRPLRARLRRALSDGADQGRLGRARSSGAADIVDGRLGAHAAAQAPARASTGRCPFHEERTPSFSVNPAEKLYYCFGCGAGGDVIKFVARDRAARLRRARSSGSPSASACRSSTRSRRPQQDAAPAAARAAARAARAGGDFYERSSGTRRRRAGARLPRRAAAWRGGLPRVPARARARRPARAQGARAGLHRRRALAAGLVNRRGNDYFPGRLALPARRRARARARLPGAQAARGRPAAGEVRQLAGGRALPQGRPALRARPRAGRDREAGPRGRRRGQHRRARAAAGRLRAGRRLDGDGAHRAAAEGALRG